MWNLRAAILALVWASSLATGCYRGTATTVSAADSKRGPEWTVVRGMTFIPQTQDVDCGAAALAMVFKHWSVPLSKDDIWRQLKPNAIDGIAAGALRDMAVKQGLRAFAIPGEEADLNVELTQGRPVLVGLVQRYGDRARAHYVVVIGINRVGRRVLMMDPARGLRDDKWDGFFSEWSAAGRTMLVVVASGLEKHDQ